MKNIGLCILSIFTFVCCKSNYPEYDETPTVEFNSAYTTIDSSDKKIKFNFMLYDGDGNFGLDNKDTVVPYVDSFQQNFYAFPHFVENGQNKELPYNFSFRIPRLRPDGDEKFIKASVTIDMYLSKTAFPYDSVFFTYFVYDRDLNKSNVDTSSLITF